MSSTKKGNHSHDGLKAHIGVDAASGLVHSLEVTPAEVAAGVMIDALIHGEERVVLGDRAYTRNDRNLEAEREEGGPVWAMPFKRKQGEELPAEHAILNRMLASLRAKVEHPFRIVKRQFGYTKVRYRGLFKNAQQLYFVCIVQFVSDSPRWLTFRTKSASPRKNQGMPTSKTDLFRVS